MVAARELKLVQVHRISVPKVGYSYLLLLLSFTMIVSSGSLHDMPLLNLFMSNMLLLY